MEIDLGNDYIGTTIQLMHKYPKSESTRWVFFGLRVLFLSFSCCVYKYPQEWPSFYIRLRTNHQEKLKGD